MNNDAALRLIRAGLGIVLMTLLSFMLSSWWGDYQTSRAEAEKTGFMAPPAGESTKTAKPADSKSEPKKPAENSRTRLEVKVDGLNFRRQPAPEAKAIRGLESGEVVTVLDTKETWFQVVDSDGVKGWISSSPTYTKVVK